MKNLIVMLSSIGLLFACQNPKPSTDKLNVIVDSWHQAAAEADEIVFFDLMTEDAVYLGTDASERWSREELREWSAEFFERESAWSFKPYDRHFYFSKNGHVVWFNELLETWMGTCRGSGVMQKHRDGWKIKHYHLSVTVNNARIYDFIELVRNDPENEYMRR